MKYFIRQLIKTFPRFVLATFLVEIEKYLVDSNSILDVGCGENSPIGLLEKDYQTTGIDAHKPAIEKSQNQKIHDKYILGDVRKLNSLVKKNSYDAVVALDLIEHLKKKDGYKLLKDMERTARKVVILVTPNGFIPQFDKKNKLQEHLSGWSVDDFEKEGYSVEGIYGTKYCNILRTEEAELKWKPRIFWALVWGILVEVTHHLYTKKNPKHSIGLLAVKKIK